ncbi:molybdopterin-dependent oxidoreductase [Mucilaginibacter sp.]|uniref:molybdopterin-dependent oxidoreductase n=1 Tax=Mucilaginibacter sp. TaxID=1882438 RepID=UPI003D0FB8E3
MKKYTFLMIIALFGLIIKPSQTQAQTAEKQASVKVTGEVITPLDLKLADLTQFKQTEVIRKDKDGNDHKYSGVVLSDILAKAGVTLGKDLRGKNLTKYILIEAIDGYQVVFALAELDKDFTNRTIILANQIDGKPLAATEGPFRIIVQDEKKPARCIKQVISIKVQAAK